MKTYKMKCFEGDEPRILVTEEFVKDNNLSINIDNVEKIMSEKEKDFFGFKTEVAIHFLPFDKVKKYYKDEFVKMVEEGKEEAPKQTTDVYEACQDFLDYMVFAWMKAMDERGHSASRSVLKLATWMRILNRTDVAEVLEDDNIYSPYGKPALIEACKMLGIKYPDYLEIMYPDYLE